MSHKNKGPQRWLRWAPWLLIFGLTGCYRASFYTDPKLVRGLEHDQWTDFFIFGLVGTEEIDVRTFCEGKPIAEVKTGGNFATSFVTAITIGIYAPRKVYVTCGAAPAKGHYSEGRKLQLDVNGSGVPVSAVVSTEDGHSQLATITPVGLDTYRVRYATGGAR